MTGIVFNPEEHTYWKGSLRVPSVTQVLHPLYNFYGIPSAVLERKSAIGNAVHLATELYDNDDLDFDSVDGIVMPYLEAWIKFKEDTKFEVLLNEHRVFHESLFYAGTLDRIGILHGKVSTIDIKTTVQLSPLVGCQLAAYEEAVRRQKKFSPERRYAVKLKSDGTYQLKQYAGLDEFPTFLALLTVQNFKNKHNIQTEEG